MRMFRRIALIGLVALAGLALVESASAQKIFSRGPTNNIGSATARGGGGFGGGGFRGGGFGGGFGVAVPGVLLTLPQYSGPRSGDVFIDDGSINDGPPGR